MYEYTIRNYTKLTHNNAAVKFSIPTLVQGYAGLYICYVDLMIPKSCFYIRYHEKPNYPIVQKTNHLVNKKIQCNNCCNQYQ